MSASDSLLLYVTGLVIVFAGTWMCWFGEKEKDFRMVETASLAVLIGLILLVMAISANWSLFYFVISNILKFFFEVAIG